MYPADETTLDMVSFAIEGNIIDHSWPFIVTLENGKPDHTAIMLLAHIVYWYRPSYDPETKMPCKKYQGDLLQRSYPELERDLGLTKREAQEAFQRLEKLDFVHREFRTIERDGIRTGNVMFLRLNFENLSLQRDLFFKNCIPLYAKTSEGVRQNVRGGTPKRQTYTKNTQEISQRSKQQQRACELPPISDLAVACSFSSAMKTNSGNINQNLKIKHTVDAQNRKEATAQPVRQPIEPTPNPTHQPTKKEAPKPKETPSQAIVSQNTISQAATPLDKLHLTKSEKNDLLQFAQLCSHSPQDFSLRLEHAVSFIEHKINNNIPITNLPGLLNFAIKNQPTISIKQEEQQKNPQENIEKNKEILHTLLTLMTFSRLLIKPLYDRIEVKIGNNWAIIPFNEEDFLDQLFFLANKEGLTPEAAKYIQEIKEQKVLM